MRLTSAEFRFMDLLWDREPVSSGELVAVCDQKFGWKKSTTYTFIKRLQEKGVIANEKSIVRALYKRDECEREESGEVVDQVFKGSLPQFVTAFLQDRKLSEKEIDELKELLDRMLADEVFLRETGTNAGYYVTSNAGATDKILSMINF